MTSRPAKPSIFKLRFEDSRAKITEASKVIRDADRHVEGNVTKIAELSSKLAKADKALMSVEEARAVVEVAKDAVFRFCAAEVEAAKKEAVGDNRSSKEFTVLLDKKVMDQCDDLVYWFKRYNADKKLNLNFLRDPHSMPECVTKEMVEAYKGEDVHADSSYDTDSSS
ncbi:unnamed protein product [Prunus armeniaca]